MNFKIEKKIFSNFPIKVAEAPIKIIPLGITLYANCSPKRVNSCTQKLGSFLKYFL